LGEVQSLCSVQRLPAASSVFAAFSLEKHAPERPSASRASDVERRERAVVMAA
jgi:hypothetical protein